MPLLIPPHRQVLPQLLQAQAVGFVAAQDRLDDVGREADQAQHSSDVGVVAADALGLVFEAGVFARIQSAATIFPLSQANSIVVRNPLHAFP